MSIGNNIGKGGNAMGWFMAISGVMLVVVGLVLIGNDISKGTVSWKILGVVPTFFGIWVGLLGYKFIKG